MGIKGGNIDLTVGNLSLSLGNVFYETRHLSWMINTRKIAKITFSATSSESGMPTGQRKLAKLSELLGKLRKSYRKVIGRSSTGLQARQIL